MCSHVQFPECGSSKLKQIYLVDVSIGFIKRESNRCQALAATDLFVPPSLTTDEIELGW
jgi:hypothetical protein